MVTDILGTVPLCAVVTNQTNESAGMVASLKDVTSEPVETDVVVVPEVTTSAPVADLSELCRIVQVTDGVEVPLFRTALISVTVMATFVKNIVISSLEVGLSMEIDFDLASWSPVFVPTNAATAVQSDAEMLVLPIVSSSANSV